MPLPILLGASVAALCANALYRSELAEQDRLRKLGIKGHNSIGRYPCDDLPSDCQVVPKEGSLVCCGVYHGFVHTGLVIDDNLVLELHGSGLSRAISFKRFLAQRSGKHMFVAANGAAAALQFALDDTRIAGQLFAYHDYHLSKRNCYSHTWYCLTGEMQPFASFESFNDALQRALGHSIYWDRADLKKLTS